MGRNAIRSSWRAPFAENPTQSQLSRRAACCSPSPCVGGFLDPLRRRFTAGASSLALLAATPALAQPDLTDAALHESNVVGVSLVVGLVIFSTITALLHLTGRKQWTQREGALVAELEAARAKARTRACLPVGGAADHRRLGLGLGRARNRG